MDNGGKMKKELIELILRFSQWILIIASMFCVGIYIGSKVEINALIVSNLAALFALMVWVISVVNAKLNRNKKEN